MSFALAATGLRSSITYFLASRRISMMLFRRAKSGARGKEATKSVTMPNWITEETNDRTNIQNIHFRNHCEERRWTLQDQPFTGNLGNKLDKGVIKTHLNRCLGFTESTVHILFTVKTYKNETIKIFLEWRIGTSDIVGIITSKSHSIWTTVGLKYAHTHTKQPES